MHSFELVDVKTISRRYFRLIGVVDEMDSYAFKILLHKNPYYTE